jgi:1-deoxy-D-xylulose-5-phosphate synthase
MAALCVDVGHRLEAQGIGVTVVDPRWVKPLDPALVELAAGHQWVVSVEDNVRVGGFGSAFTQALQDARVDTPVQVFGVPPRFLAHGKRDALLAEIGLSAQDLARQVVETVAGAEGQTLPEPAPVEAGPVAREEIVERPDGSG